jgi:hypothetical protein
VVSFGVVNTLLHSEILKDTHTGTINLERRWLKVDAAVSYSGISRAVLYRILAEGKIRSSSYEKPSPGILCFGTKRRRGDHHLALESTNSCARVVLPKWTTASVTQVLPLGFVIEAVPGAVPALLF